MRRVLGWTFLLIGVCLAALGLGDAGIAWWSQRQPVEPASLVFSTPPGFTAKLEIPRLDASLYLVNEKTPRDLRRGPGFIYGSVAPGDHGNCIIAGHRDLHFRFLKDIRVGDVVTIETKQGQFRYRVSSAEVVKATDRDALRPSYPRQLTLVTCYPFFYVGPAPKRFLVKAYLLDQS